MIFARPAVGIEILGFRVGEYLILFGLVIIAFAIASVPYSSKVIKPAYALSDIARIEDGLFNITKAIKEVALSVDKRQIHS